MRELHAEPSGRVLKERFVADRANLVEPVILRRAVTALYYRVPQPRRVVFPNFLLLSVGASAKERRRRAPWFEWHPHWIELAYLL